MTLNKMRAVLLCSAAVGVMGLAAGRPASADTPCVISGGGTVATCTGDQSDGVSAASPVEVLNVNHLDRDITPATNVDGIYFFSSGPVTVNSYTGWNEISVNGVDADGVVAQSASTNTVTLNHVGNIRTTDGYGIYTTSWGDVSSTSYSRIDSGSDGIRAQSFQTGDVSVAHAGSITAGGYGIYATASSQDVSISNYGDIDGELGGILAISYGSGVVTINHTGDIVTGEGTGDPTTGYGVYATANAAIQSTTVGDISGYKGAIYLTTGTSGAVTVSHTGALNSATGYGLFVQANAPIDSTTVGRITSELDGLHLDSRTTTTTLVFSHDGDITSSNGYGIYANASNASISGSGSGSIDAELDGISLNSQSSVAQLNLAYDGDITSHNGSGVTASSSNGPVYLSLSGRIDAAYSGVYVYNPSGPYVNVTQDGDIVTHTASDFVNDYIRAGIFANASVGAVTISGSGDITSASNGVYGQSLGLNTDVSITRSGVIDAAEFGIYGRASQGVVTITNVGDVSGGAAGIYGYSTGINTDVTINQTGDVLARGGSAIFPHDNLNFGSASAGGYGVMGAASTGNVTINVAGGVQGTVAGIYAYTGGNNKDVIITQSGGDIVATGGSAVLPHANSSVSPGGYGIFARAPNSGITISSTSNITSVLDGIYAWTAVAAPKPLTIQHVGDITSSQGNGIYAFATDAVVTVTNTGAIDAALTGIDIDTVTAQKITLNQFGDVTARGGDGISVRATSGEIEGTVTGNVDSTANGIYFKGSGSFDLTLGGGTVSAATGYTGVYFDGGFVNSLTNYGTIRTADGVDGVAVFATLSDTTIDNYGRVVGDVDLYEWTNAFNNHEGALFEAGATVDLGEWNYLTNDGTFSPGGQGRIITTSLTGGYVNNADATFLVDIDMDNSTADLVQVSDNADLSGRLKVNFISFDGTPQTFTIMTTGDAVTTQDLTLAQPVLLADITYPGNTQVDLTIYGADFNPAGLGGNPGAVGDHLTRAFYAGSPGLAPVFNALIGLDSTAAVDDALRQLTPDVMLSAKLADLYGGLDFADGLMSCKVAGGAATFGAEGECAWARARYNNLEVDGSTDEPGFSQDTGEFSAGAQFSGGGDWRFGFALGAAFVDLESDGTDQQVDGTRVEGGVVAKYVPGPWLFAAAVSGTWGWYDSTRRVDFGGYSSTFDGSPEVGTLNGRLRAAYTAGDDAFYVRPQVDLNATLVHMSGFSESGGAGAMSFDGETDTIVSLAPAIEIGAQTDLGDGMLLRGFLRGGVDWFMDPELNVTGAFVDAGDGAGDFTISTSPDDVLWTVSAGADLFTSGGITVRAAYDGKFGESTTDNAVSLKLSMDF